MGSKITRRTMLGASAAGILLPAMAGASVATASRKRSIRIAHITDMHVQPELGAAKGLELCIHHLQNQHDKPDMVFCGGDMIMDSLGASKDRVALQWAVFKDVLKANLELPIEYAIGNHDVWGWSAREKYAAEPKFGKTWALEQLEIPKPYKSFDRAGWHFIILDSTHPVDGNGYTARLDDEQFEWLRGDLASVLATTPIFVMSHIPIIGVCSMFDGDNEKSGNWVIPGAWVHIDARRIKDLFRKHPNVKMCISGHEHLLDQVVYNGVNYFCNGAVSAAWWRGDYQECTYGYAMVDLFDDGSFDNTYVSYGWKTQV